MERERINGLKEIKTKEEYDAVKVELDGYLGEYKLFGKGEKSMKAIEKAIESSLKKYEEQRKDLTAEQERAILGEIQMLQNRYNSISDGSFEPKIKQNITACILALEAYDAKIQSRNIFDVIKGMIQGDADTKEYLKKKYTLDFANITGAVPGTVNMNLAPMSEILDTISKNYDLVGIEIPKQETSIVPASEKSMNKIMQTAMEMCEVVLEERGLADASNKKQNKEVSSIEQHNETTRSSLKTIEKVEKSKEEKGEEREIGE